MFCCLYMVIERALLNIEIVEERYKLINTRCEVSDITKLLINKTHTIV